MSLDKMVLAFAGVMTLLSVVLTVYVSPYFLWFTVFIGLNLLQSAFTGFCPAAMIFKKLGAKADYWKTGHSHMKRRVKEIGALAGFEKSGHYFLAVGLLARGQVAEARAHWQEAIKLDPSFTRARQALEQLK